MRLEMLPTEPRLPTAEMAPEVLDVQTRWRNWRQDKDEKERSNLVSIFQTRQRTEFMKLLEPPALFSAVPASSASENAIMPESGILPIRPEYKGDCILLPSNV